VFDLVTFAILLGPFAAGALVFRSGWFVESLLTELMVALVVRTRGSVLRSRPGRVLLWTTLALLPLTLIASIGGMNVKLPGDGSIAEFWAILLTMAVILAGVLYFFRRRGYL